LQENSKQLFVGFNRRYSQFIIKIKELMKNFIDYPIFINYRINAGYVPNNHCEQNPDIGGGRIIGEVCHFIDLINYLVEDEINKYNIVSIPINGKNVFNNDNVAINFSYNNGSIAQLSYLSNGSKAISKERLEIFCAGKSIVIDDFLKIQFHGFNQKNIELKKKDKGHKRELVEIYNKLKNKTSIIPSINYDLLATKLTFEIVDKINGVSQ